jgi:hypothetical protein
MGYAFRTGLHACEVDDTIIILDLPADRYFALGPRAGAACTALAAGADEGRVDATALERLVADEVLIAANQGSRPHLCKGPVSGTRYEGADAGIGRHSAVAMAVTRHLVALFEVRVRPLANILDGLGSSKRSLRHASGDDRSAGDVGAAFLASDRVLSPTGRCLPRSVALARALKSAGVVADLVIGVKLHPFEAHCWVQVGGKLVAEESATVAPFTPILIR